MKLFSDGSYSIDDDLGEPSAINFRALRESAAWRDARSRRIILASQARARPFHPLFAAFLFSLLIGIILVILGYSNYLRFAYPASFVFVLLAMSPALNFTKHVVRKRRDSIIAPVLRIGRCPACAYDLTDIEPRRDGRERGHRVCPECGSAWRDHRVHGSRRNDLMEHPPLKRLYLTWCGHSGGTTHSIYTHDDSGADTPLLIRTAPQYLREMGRAMDASYARRWRLADRDARAGGRTRRRIMGFGVLLFYVMLSFLAVAVAVSAWRNLSNIPTLTGRSLRVFGALFFLVLIVFGLVFLPRRILDGVTGVDANQARSAMLKHRLCPSCSEDLLHVRKDAMDGSVTCPWCSATWLIPS